jgi:aryl-alcohol dehydrogenase-like predicted oxidoreductase
MMDWQTHLRTLKAWKAEGRIRYIGITTSHGSRSGDLEAAMKRERFDFVQFTYNLTDRSVESRLLPLARDRGAAVIVNRPFDGGRLFRQSRGKPMPALATEMGCKSWADYFLKFIISHPAVTCAIPATSQAMHMTENMHALIGELPDSSVRRQMAAYWDKSA